MRTTNLFISDWAGYPELYPKTASQFEFVLPFLTHSEEDIFHRIDKGGTTLIAWSLGAHIVLKRWERAVSQFDNILLMAPFLSFSDYQSEMKPDTMSKFIRTTPDKAVRQYQVLSGYPGAVKVKGEDREGLLKGLEFMHSSRAMPSHHGAQKTTIIHGEYDRIIPPLASEDIWEIMPEATFISLTHSHWIPEQWLQQHLIEQALH